MQKPYIHTEQVHNLNAPREVVPLILKLTKCKTVLDVGCGTGTWLKAFEENGIEKYTGVDGDYVNRDSLRIPINKFVALDLQKSWSLNTKFDLVVCLEVAEHLPEVAADTFIETLTRHGDVIIFSAAIPAQGGQNHVNEQWPEYWQLKFIKHGFYFHDVIRPQIWNNPKVEWWYRQNMFLVSKEKPILDIGFGAVVHPELFKLSVSNFSEMFKSLVEGRQGLRLATRIFLNSILFKIRSWFGV